MEPSVVQLCAPCQKPAQSSCSKCWLVVYCGKPCQQDHWAVHRKSCNSPLARKDWSPSSFDIPISDLILMEPIKLSSERKYLWGNMPAYDILHLEKNEGVDFKETLNLMFAASGDLRDVVETIASLPPRVEAPMRIFINDQDEDVVARNLIFVLTLFTATSGEEAADCILHLWYSATITKVHFNILSEKVRPLIEQAISSINRVNKDVQANDCHSHAWRFGSVEVSVAQHRRCWLALRAILENPPNFSGEDPKAIRKLAIQNSVPSYHLDMILYTMLPEHRASHAKYLEDGLILPFGHSRASFDVPNPTLFKDGRWLMDTNEPLKGWDHTKILSTSSAPCSHDIYGKFHAFVKSRLICCHSRLADVRKGFMLTCHRAEHLKPVLGDVTFARIETSNIADRLLLGIEKTLDSFSTLLSPPRYNPHATLTTLFMVAVQDMAGTLESQEQMTRNLMLVDSYLSLDFMKSVAKRALGKPKLVQLHNGVPFARDGDRWFLEYMKQLQFDNLQRLTGLRMKEKHTIVDKWPTKPQLGPEEPGAKEAFKRHVASGHLGSERYVEWQRST